MSGSTGDRGPGIRPGPGTHDATVAAPGAPPAGAGWAWIALAALAWFAVIGWRDLIHPDEGRYAELARHMFASGDWVTPRLNGVLYFEKPVLQYWATAAAYAMLGSGEAGARLWPALCGALGVVATWAAARRAHGAGHAAAAACVLSGSAWWVFNSHFVNLDTGLACFMSIAMLGFWIAQRDAATPREARFGMVAAWAAMALAVLSKGLVGVVLPGAVLVAYSVLARDFSVWRRMRWLEGLAVLLAISAPWFVVVSLRNPDFAHFFFVHEHFERFTTTRHARTGAWWYFFPILAAGALPWTTMLPGALAAGWRRQPGRFQSGRLFAVWAVTIFAFFSASGSKLPSYILPLFPALALLIAAQASRMSTRRLGWHAAAPLVAALALAALLWFAPQRFGRGGQVGAEALAYRDWLLAACGLIACASAPATALAWRGRRLACLATLSLGSIVACQVAMLGHQVFAATKSARTMVEAVRNEVAADQPFYSIRTHDQTLPFYLGRPVTLVDWTDEFATGLRIEPERGVPTLERFEALWREARPGTAALVPVRELPGLERAGLPLRVVYRDPDRVVVVRP